MMIVYLKAYHEPGGDNSIQGTFYGILRGGGDIGPYPPNSILSELTNIGIVVFFSAWSRYLRLVCFYWYLSAVSQSFQ